MYLSNNKTRKVVWWLQHITGILLISYFSSLQDIILPENPARFDAFRTNALQTLGFLLKPLKEKVFLSFDTKILS
jgi:succinate dehydrogenase hydrophobic anchor subunit